MIQNSAVNRLLRPVATILHMHRCCCCSVLLCCLSTTHTRPPTSSLGILLSAYHVRKCARNHSPCVVCWCRGACSRAVAHGVTAATHAECCLGDRWLRQQSGSTFAENCLITGFSALLAAASCHVALTARPIICFCSCQQLCLLQAPVGLASGALVLAFLLPTSAVPLLSSAWR